MLSFSSSAEFQQFCRISAVPNSVPEEVEYLNLLNPVEDSLKSPINFIRRDNGCQDIRGNSFMEYQEVSGQVFLM